MSCVNAIGQLMLARQDGIVKKEKDTLATRSYSQAEDEKVRFRAKYSDISQDRDPYSDKSLHDRIGFDQHVGQRYSPLTFLSGRVSESQLDCSTLEKEAYPIMTTVDHMHLVLGTSAGFDLFTDHHNLVFLFDPLAVVSELSQTDL